MSRDRFITAVDSRSWATFKSGIAVGFFLGAMAFGLAIFLGLFVVAPAIEYVYRYLFSL